ncbi:MAG: terminase large subunit, partial [Enterobacter asburiae]|nr:terminase large subunit [Enterobacter asburiae]
MTRGERVIAFIERYCIVPEGKLLGKPMQLDPFQKEFILAVYDNPVGTDKAILSIARKNGKTGLIAGILLAHLVGPEAVQNTQIVSGALSREQASIVFNLAVKMVNLNPDLQVLVHIIPSGKKLIGLPCNVEYKALSAEGKTTHGLSPILAILDETGQVRGPQDDFIDAITTAQGAHENPLLIVISTQAANDADLLSIWID